MRFPVTEPPLDGPQPPDGGPAGLVAQRADRILAGLLALTALYGLALTPVAPSMVGTHPVLLEFLRGSPASMITAGAMVRTGDVPLILALLAGTSGCIMFDWLYWWAGVRWGERAIAMLVQGRPRTTGQVQRLQGTMHRRGSAVVLLSYILPLPTALVDVLAGWSGMSLRRFLVLDAIAALIWVGALVAAGYAIGQPAVDAAKAVSRYGLYIGVAIFAVVLLRQRRRA